MPRSTNSLDPVDGVNTAPFVFPVEALLLPALFVPTDGCWGCSVPSSKLLEPLSIRIRLWDAVVVAMLVLVLLEILEEEVDGSGGGVLNFV